MKVQPHSFSYLLHSYRFWLLLIGSFCSIGSIGAVNFHMKFVFQDQGFRDQVLRDAVWAQRQRHHPDVQRDRPRVHRDHGGQAPHEVGHVRHLLPGGRHHSGAACGWRLPGTPWIFSLLFGLAMGADYMLIPLMAAKQFGVNTLARAMAVILPVNTIGQTWFPYFVSRAARAFGGLPGAAVHGVRGWP